MPRAWREFISLADRVQSELKIRNQISKELGPEQLLKPSSNVFSATSAFGLEVVLSATRGIFANKQELCLPLSSGKVGLEGRGGRHFFLTLVCPCSLH